MGTKPLLRESFFLVILSVFLSVVYNSFSPKGLPLIRKPATRTVAADSTLFSPRTPKTGSTSGSSSMKQQIPVFAPLHQRALANPDSMAALMAKKEKSEFTIVTLEQVKRLLSEHRALFIDARGADEYEKGHIKGALNIPYLEVDKHFEEIVNIPRDTLVVVYCHNPDCSVGRDLVSFMKQLEFRNLLVYDNGWDEWEKTGMPIKKSSPGK